LLSVFADNLDDNVTVSRNAAGQILINGGAVAVQGGSPTVANTTLIQVFGQGGNDTIALDEATAPCLRPSCSVARQRHRHRRSGNDLLFGGAGNDTLLGKAGNDLLLVARATTR